MLLVIDIGNTSIAIGLYAGDELTAHWRMTTNPQNSSEVYAQELFYLISTIHLKDRVSASIISCVVPSLNLVFAKVLQELFSIEPMFVDAATTKLPICYDHPDEVGSDRIVNALAAYRLYGGPAIVVDLGTATTFDVISEKGEYLGGAIAPGIFVSSETLWTKTALLPRVEITKPGTVIGKTTITSMQAGIFYGAIGQIDEIVGRIMGELKGVVKVIATGGLAELISYESRYIQVINPLLTLQGLKIIYDER